MKNTVNRNISLFVPGRLCLFGEHSDWAGVNRLVNPSITAGCAVVTGIEQGVYGTACKSDQFIVYSKLDIYNSQVFSCDMDNNLLRDVAREGSFFSYVAGVASYMCEWYHVGGITLEITKMDLPIKSGLSSSAAICVLVAQAFNELYDLRLNTLGIMNIAYWGELRTPSRCGRLDQACAFGVNPVTMIFDGNEIDVNQISLRKPLYYVFADLMSSKDTVKILADLSLAYPVAEDEKQRHVQEALGPDNQAITSRAIEYMSLGDVRALGQLMIEAQELFDSKVAPMCPSELTAPILHSVLNDSEIKNMTVGAKGVGSQGDGTVQFLCENEYKQKELIDYLQNVRKMNAYPLTLRPEKGITKAIIPVAGFGTRMYPATRGVKKEFLPVVDKDGLVKPGILVLLEELYYSGIEEICLILNRNEKEYYENYFFKKLPQEHFDKLNSEMRKYEELISEISTRLTFVFQDEQKGFGHAVYQAKQFVGDKPVLLLLGDTIYSTNRGISCTSQLISSFEKNKKTTVALQSIPLSDVRSYGVFAGEWNSIDNETMKCTRIVEKPSSNLAENELCMFDKGGEKKCYGAFGSYVLTKEVFDRLQYAIDNCIVNSKGEIELTDAIAYVANESGVYGQVIDGKSYDLGNPISYRCAVASFGLI